MKRIHDRGLTKGHRYVVLNGANREAGFNTREDAEAYIKDSQLETKLPAKLKPTKKSNLLSFGGKEKK